MVKRLSIGSMLLVVLVVLGLAVSGAFAAGATKDTYLGKWTVSKVVLTVKGAGLSSAKSKTYLNKVLSLAPASAAFGTSKITNPSYQVSEMTASDFTSSWSLPAKSLGLGANIGMVEVYSGKGMTSELWTSIGTLFVKSKDALVMHVDGVFFELKRK